MFPIPAIDLKEGRVVRLRQGQFKEEKVYDRDPAQIARDYEADGAARIHVVDLDGALHGEPKNLPLVEKAVRAVKAPVEVGGGIRDLDRVRRYFEIGVKWVILGTKACLDKGFLKEAIAEFGDRVIVGVDAKAGQVAVDAWTRYVDVQADDLAKSVQACGGKTIIYTDIARDGAMTGPNLKQIAWMTDSVEIDVIASGGVSSLKDLEALRALKKKNLKAVVIGTALYEKKFSLKQAIQACLQNA